MHPAGYDSGVQTYMNTPRTAGFALYIRRRPRMYTAELRLPVIPMGVLC
ncbi:hypothetical protein JOE26_000421 [Rhodococcus coprophilus]|uniref:Uncharacterized protein n=1 Tax=Rhodococcus coprophilus TaxID=38310 RepID=A0A2X4TSD7_9NOCA|nr:hypothetical protein [Rhodococcus coprophilus]SQI30367.1 Uncharacterised protein [Rhodococcus coprophilus]